MNTSHGARLDRTQELAIAALLSCRTIKAAAERCAVDEATLRAWLRLPEFLAEYRAARRAVVEGAIARLQRATSKAVATLERNLKCGRPGDEIRSALGILQHATHAVEVTDLQERIEALEARQ